MSIAAGPHSPQTGVVHGEIEDGRNYRYMQRTVKNLASSDRHRLALCSSLFAASGQRFPKCCRM
jgi:hypothetical protein